MIIVTIIYILKRDPGKLPFVYISVVAQAEASEKILLLAWNRVFVRLELWSSWKTLSQRRPLVRPSVPNLIHQRAPQRSCDGISRRLDFHSAMRCWEVSESRSATGGDIFTFKCFRVWLYTSAVWSPRFDVQRWSKGQVYCISKFDHVRRLQKEKQCCLGAQETCAVTIVKQFLLHRRML